MTNSVTAYTPVPIPSKPGKKERTPEEKKLLMNQFLLGINSYHVGEVSSDNLNKINNYVIQGDGVYLVIQNSIGQFITKIIDRDFPGLPKQFNGTRIKLNVPKIPSEIYYQIVAFFTDISEEMGEAEAFCQVHYDKEEKQYIVQVPEQTVGKASVTYDATKSLSAEDPERYSFVFEIHSHNTMNAFWSGTDNADEKDTRFYGVLGCLDKDEIAEKYRYMIMGKEIEVKKEHIFDFEEDLTIDKTELIKFINDQENLTIDDVEQFINQEDDIEYPANWIDNINKPVYNRNYYQGPNPYKPYQKNLSVQSQKNQNFGTTGRPTHSRQKQIEMFGHDYDDGSWQDDVPSYKSGYNMDSPEIEMYERMHLEDIRNAYDMTDLREVEEEEQAIEMIASTIEPYMVPLLIEKLVDYGYDAKIREVTRG